MFLLTVFFPLKKKGPYTLSQLGTQKPVFMGCPWSVVWWYEDLDFHIHGCYACLLTIPQEAVCGYVYIHTSHVIIDSSYIMHLKKPQLKVFAFLFQYKTGRQSTVWNTSVQRCWSRTNGKESSQASDALNQKILVVEWLILKVSEFMCGTQKIECYFWGGHINIFIIIHNLCYWLISLFQV